MTVSSNVGYCF